MGIGLLLFFYMRTIPKLLEHYTIVLLLYTYLGLLSYLYNRRLLPLWADLVCQPVQRLRYLYTYLYNSNCNILLNVATYLISLVAHAIYPTYLIKLYAWWNEETRQATKLKKQSYKKWLRDPTPQKKERYQSARDACKHVIKQAKEKAWSEYGSQMEDMRKTEAMKSFHKKVKSMREREQPYCPITIIKDAQGQIITDKHQIKQRWGGYLEGLPKSK